MSARASWTLLALIVALAPGPALGAARFALVLGNNQGAPDRPKLWFAERDAERFARALVELGDFDRERVRLVRGAGTAELRGALEALDREIGAARAGGERSLLVVYFSGHAGPGGLELGRERLAFADLRRMVEQAPADAKIAIVDACESGTLTQVKGASAAPDLDFVLPAEDSARGVAYIASTAAGEAAQESALLGGSFFTFHLDAALRGAGDADGDGQVTLNEAFRYTSGRTITNTAATQVGPQHPTYDIKMSGRGDVVLSDLRRAEARLALPGDANAAFLLSGPTGLVAEVPGGTTVALPAGHYRVERRSGSARSVTDVELARGDARALPTMTEVGLVASRSKGGARPMEVFAGAALDAPPLDGATVAPGVRLGLRRGGDAVSWRLRVDLSSASGEDRGLRYGLTTVGGSAAALFRVVDGTLRFGVGPELGAAWTRERLESGSQFDGIEGTGGLAAELGIPMGRFGLALQGAAGGRVFKLNEAVVIRPKLDAGLVASFAF